MERRFTKLPGGTLKCFDQFVNQPRAASGSSLGEEAGLPRRRKSKTGQPFNRGDEGGLGGDGSGDGGGELGGGGDGEGGDDGGVIPTNSRMAASSSSSIE